MVRKRPDGELAREVERWRRGGSTRPPGAPVPGPGEESVWDYPRPPRLERVEGRVRVELGGVVVADSSRAWRVCETASPPTYYIPREGVRAGTLERSGRRSFCEWKGPATYWTVRAGDRVERDAAWSYEDVFEAYAPIEGAVAFYAGRMDACFVGEDRVEPQHGGFYGGWVTPGVLGPFKGEPGTGGW